MVKAPGAREFLHLLFALNLIRKQSFAQTLLPTRQCQITPKAITLLYRCDATSANAALRRRRGRHGGYVVLTRAGQSVHLHHQAPCRVTAASSWLANLVGSHRNGIASKQTV